jgi:protein-disulfide isomerase
VNSTLLNRVVLVLSMFGTFVAAVMSYSAAFKVEVPCRADATVSCASVTNSPFSLLFGVNVAHLGLVTYLAILALAFYRARATGLVWSQVTRAGFILSGIGMGFSLFLQTMSLTQIGSLCYWCLASFLAMLGLFILHGMIAQRGEPALIEDERKLFMERRKDSNLLIGAAILAIASFGFTAAGMRTEATAQDKSVQLEGITVEEILGDGRKMIGNKDAKVTVVEVADFNCPACRMAAPRVKALYEKYGGRVRLAYVNFPLYGIPGHETSIAAAMASEFAAEKGKFWEFANKVFDPANAERVKSEGGIYGIASELGLDRTEMRARMDVDKDDSLLNRVNDDMHLVSQRMKLNGTPKYLLIVEGRPIEAYEYPGLEAALQRPSVAALIK